jgi:hypothetical protein
LRWPHDSFEVIDSGEYWDVVGFNTDNPSVKVLANRCENRTYAEMLAADLNGLNDVNQPMLRPPSRQPNENNCP